MDWWMECSYGAAWLLVGFWWSHLTGFLFLYANSSPMTLATSFQACVLTQWLPKIQYFWHNITCQVSWYSPSAPALFYVTNMTIASVTLWLFPYPDEGMNHESAICYLLMLCRCLFFWGYFVSFIPDYSAINLTSRWHISQSPWVIAFSNPTLVTFPLIICLLQLSETTSHVTVTASMQRSHSIFSNLVLLWHNVAQLPSVKRNVSDKHSTTWQQREMG